MSLLIRADAGGRPVREVLTSVGEALARARDLQTRARDVAIRDAGGRWHTPDEFAAEVQRLTKG